MKKIKLDSVVEDQAWVYFKRENYAAFEKLRSMGYGNSKNCPILLRKKFQEYEKAINIY